MKSIVTGVKQYKGAIYIEVCPPVTPQEIGAFAGECCNDMMRGVAAVIDRRIHRGYRLFATNYMAYDMRGGTAVFAGERYSQADRVRFEEYMDRQARGVEGDVLELKDILLDIYANPVANKLAAGGEA